MGVAQSLLPAFFYHPLPPSHPLTANAQTYLLYLIGTRMRNTLMAAIFRKCLRLSNSALQVCGGALPPHAGRLLGFWVGVLSCQAI